jgi:hypothetical protein
MMKTLTIGIAILGLVAMHPDTKRYIKISTM